MKKLSSQKFVSCLIIFFVATILLISTQAFAQVPYNPFLYNPYLAVNPYYPPVPPAPLFPLYTPAPIFNPYLIPPVPVSRTGAATIVLLPAATPLVSAAAPLGTLSLTPTTLVFLTLFLSLAE